MTTMLPMKFTQSTAELFETGWFYIGGRDRHYRPYNVIRPAVLMANQPKDPNDAIACVLLNVGFIFSNMLHDGVCEQIVSIMNQEGLALWGFNFSLMNSIIKVLSEIQLGRSRGMYILNAASFISALFKGVSYFLDASTLAKVQVSSSPTNELVSKLIAPEQLEE